MLAVYAGDEFVGLVDEPRYVYKKKSSGAWVEAKDLDAAEAVAVNSKIYNLEGKAKVDENAKTVRFQKVDLNGLMLAQDQKIEQQKADIEYLAAMTGVDLGEGEVENGEN